MLAFAWPRHGVAPNQSAALAKRLGSSLCAGIGGHAGTAEIGAAHFAYRPLHSIAATSRSWRPVVLPSGRVVLFHGYFDNANEVAARLSADPSDTARLYGLALECWGDEAERLIIGEYCAVVADPERSTVRLTRSPLRAPPLYYFHEHGLTAAASVPRAVFAAGAPQKLNETRIADSLMRNLSDDEASSFEGISQVPTGSIVELLDAQPRQLKRWYSVMDIAMRDVQDDRAAIAKASELLDEGIRTCIAGFNKPGCTVSAGLDSPQVAVRALNALPMGQKLPTFTFHPEPGFDGHVPRHMMGDERPMVEKLAARYPRLEPHFTCNAGFGHDHRWKELFHLTGTPSGLSTMYVFHGLLSEAAEVKCDVLLLAEWGNLTFSDQGEAAFVEYFLKGKWHQLWLALTRPPTHDGSIARRVLARTAAAFLPDSTWRWLRRFVRPGRAHLADVVRPLSADYRRASGAESRLRSSGVHDRYQPWSRRHSRALLFENGNTAEVYQGFEQMYGIALRDPTAYRPFVEYCLSLPTKMFMRDGQMRWLAVQMGQHIIPPEQVNNSLNGWWDADWHLRIGRRREEWLSELGRIEQDDRLGKMFDVPRLRAALEDWPNQTEIDPQKAFAVQLAVPIALMAARFIDYVEGRNNP